MEGDTLLTQPRSDDVEVACEPEAGEVDALVKPSMHPITGTFADSLLTTEFAAQGFRRSFVLHVVGTGLMAFLMMIIAILHPGLVPPNVAALISVLCVFGLLVRVVVHQWEDETKAQMLGGLVWTSLAMASMPLESIFIAITGPEEFCAALDYPSALYLNPLASGIFAVMNSSHGLEFWHATAVVGAKLICLSIEWSVCHHAPATNLGIGTLVAVAMYTHMQQLEARHSFLRLYHIQESRDRLDFFVQLSERRTSRANGKPPAIREAGCSEPDQSSASEAGPSTSNSNGLHVPLFMLDNALRARFLQQQQQRDAQQHSAEQEDAASDALSLDHGAPAPQGVWEWSSSSSSAPSTATRNVRRRQREIEKLRKSMPQYPKPEKV